MRHSDDCRRGDRSGGGNLNGGYRASQKQMTKTLLRLSKKGWKGKRSVNEKTWNMVNQKAHAREKNKKLTEEKDTVRKKTTPKG